MFRKLLICFLIFTSFFIFDGKIFAYDDKTTHPALTDEIVDFYNLFFSNKQLTPQQKEWVVKGSILEDTPPRWINHFYDPIYKEGWSGEKTGKISEPFVRLFSYTFLAFLQKPLSAVQWVNNEFIQSTYSFYEGNRTWKKALEYYANNEEEQAYKTLGYILHLLEDQSVPDHTRNDTHAHELEKLTSDYGSPYEEYLKKYTRQTIKELNIASGLKQDNLNPISRNSIEDYLISLAEYSNRYFFSKDTINDSKYLNPKVIKEDENFGYGIDENKEEFPLVLIYKQWDDKKNHYANRYLLEKDELPYYPILDAYFSRLSRQAVLHGAGVINLFLKQGEDEKINKYYPARLIKYDVSRITPPVFSVVGSGIELINGAKNAALAFGGYINSAVSGVVSSIGSLFSGITGDEKDFQQANLQQTIKNNETQTFDSQNILASEENNSTKNLQAADESVSFVIEQQNNNLIENSGNLTIDEKPKLPSNFQVQLDDIKNKADDLNNQIQVLASQPAKSASNGYLITYFGGGRGGAPVILSASGNNNSAVNQQLDNQKQTTQNSQQNSVSTENLTSIEIASSTEAIVITASTTTISTIENSTSTNAITTSTVNIVISEILFDAEASDKGKEFIELYNSASSSIDLTGWSLKYFRENSTSTKSLAVFGNKSEDKTLIAANSFLLIGLNSYEEQNYNGVFADILRTEALPNGNEETIVVLYDEQGNEIDRIVYDKNSIADEGRSLERLAWKSEQCVSSQGAGEFLGNGCDTGEKNDFINRELPNPQNSSSLPEPRSVPTAPQGFNIQYSSSTNELIFNWLESQDYSGSTSTLIYQIREINNSSSVLPVIISTSTSASVVISEFDRNYEFVISAFDKDGLESATLSADIYIDALPILNATSTDVSATTTDILLSQTDFASSSIGASRIYQEFGNGISGKLLNLELNMSTGNACQYFYFQEFNDGGYSQLLREFTARKQNPDSIPDFSVRFSDGSLWNQGVCIPYNGKIIIEFNKDIEVDPSKYYRLFFDSGDVFRNAVFYGSNFDAGFGDFKACNQKADVSANGLVYRWYDCLAPDFDAYFVLKGIRTDNDDVLSAQ